MSIGPSLTATDRTRPTRTDESTDAPETNAETEPASFALRYAKWTFDPFNTHPCPEMFGDKWAAEEQASVE